VHRELVLCWLRGRDRVGPAQAPAPPPACLVVGQGGEGAGRSGGGDEWGVQRAQHGAERLFRPAIRSPARPPCFVRKGSGSDGAGGRADRRTSRAKAAEPSRHTVVAQHSPATARGPSSGPLALFARQPSQQPASYLIDARG